MKPTTNHKLYLAGPMRGKPLYNFPAFDAEAIYLRNSGWIVFNPADFDREHGFDPLNLDEDFDYNNPPPNFNVEAAARRDVEAVFDCDVIIMLPGWKESTGASAEHALALWLGKDIWYRTSDDPISNGIPRYVQRSASSSETSHKETIVEEAARLVNGPRRQEYGHPKINFARVAKSWEPILETDVSPTQVAQCMIALKNMRACQSPSHRDTWVDIAGYSQTAAIIEGIDE